MEEQIREMLLAFWRGDYGPQGTYDVRRDVAKRIAVLVSPWCLCDTCKCADCDGMYAMNHNAAIRPQWKQKYTVHMCSGFAPSNADTEKE